MFKANNNGTRTTRRSSNFVVNFEHISHLILVFLLSTLSSLRDTCGILENKKVLLIYTEQFNF